MYKIGWVEINGIEAQGKRILLNLEEHVPYVIKDFMFRALFYLFDCLLDTFTLPSRSVHIS